MYALIGRTATPQAEASALADRKVNDCLDILRGAWLAETLIPSQDILNLGRVETKSQG